MDRSLYPEDVEVHAIDLQRTEQTKISNMQLRLTDSSTSGVVSGLTVSLNSGSATLINVASGIGYTPSGERVVVPIQQTGIALDNYTTSTLNYVCVVYVETQGAPEPEEMNGTLQNTRSIGSFKISVYSAADFALLPTTTTTSVTDAAGNIITTTDYTTDSIDRIVLAGTVVAAGSGVNIPSNNITNVPALQGATSITPQTPITGVQIAFLDHSTPAGTGAIQLNVLTGPITQLQWKAPGDASYGAVVPFTADGLYTLTATSGHTLQVQVTYPLLPSVTTAAPLTVTNIYSQALPHFSPDDVLHRSYLGSGIPTVNNPHGLTLADIGDTGASALEVHQIEEHVNGIQPASNVNLLKAYARNFDEAEAGWVEFVAFGTADNIYVNGNIVSGISSTVTTRTAGGNTTPGTGAPGSGTVPYVTFTDLMTGTSQSIWSNPGPSMELYEIYIDEVGDLIRLKRGILTTTSTALTVTTYTNGSVPLSQLCQYVQIIGCSETLTTTSGLNGNGIINIVMGKNSSSGTNVTYLAVDTTQSTSTINLGTEPRCVVLGGGSDVDLTADTVFRLFLSNHVDWVDVCVYKFASSPIASYTEYIQINSPPVMNSSFPLCSFPWSGSRGLSLGYGFDSFQSSFNGGAFQNPLPYAVRDLRTIGNLSYANVNSASITQINNFDKIAGTGFILDFNPNLLGFDTLGVSTDPPINQAPYTWANNIEQLTASLTTCNASMPSFAQLVQLDADSYSQLPLWSLGGYATTGSFIWSSNGSTLFMQFQSPHEPVAGPQIDVSTPGVYLLPSASYCYSIVVAVYSIPSSTSTTTVTLNFSGLCGIVSNWLSSISSVSAKVITYPSFRVAVNGKINVIPAGTLTVATPATGTAAQYLYVDSSLTLKSSAVNWPSWDTTITQFGTGNLGFNPNLWNDADKDPQLVVLGIAWVNTSTVTAFNMLPQPTMLTALNPAELGVTNYDLANIGELHAGSNSLTVFPSAPTQSWSSSKAMDPILGTPRKTVLPQTITLQDEGSVGAASGTNTIQSIHVYAPSQLGSQIKFTLPSSGSSQLEFWVTNNYTPTREAYLSNAGMEIAGALGVGVTAPSGAGNAFINNQLQVGGSFLPVGAGYIGCNTLGAGTINNTTFNGDTGTFSETLTVEGSHGEQSLYLQTGVGQNNNYNTAGNLGIPTTFAVNSTLYTGITGNGSPSDVVDLLSLTAPFDSLYRVSGYMGQANSSSTPYLGISWADNTEINFVASGYAPTSPAPWIVQLGNQTGSSPHTYYWTFSYTVWCRSGQALDVFVGVSNSAATMWAACAIEALN